MNRVWFSFALVLFLALKQVRIAKADALLIKTLFISDNKGISVPKESTLESCTLNITGSNKSVTICTAAQSEFYHQVYEISKNCTNITSECCPGFEPHDSKCIPRKVEKKEEEKDSLDQISICLLIVCMIQFILITLLLYAKSGTLCENLKDKCGSCKHRDSKRTNQANAIDMPDFGYYEDLNQKNESAAAKANTEEEETENVYERTSTNIEPNEFKIELNEKIKAKAANFEKFPKSDYGKTSPASHYLVVTPKNSTTKMK